jgi:signal transduction histidine kinase/CheY-like chemotaxis protein
MMNEIREADEYTQLLLDAMPVSCILRNKDFDIINCNLEALELFGVKDFEELRDRFLDLMPEYQPDGENSAIKGRIFLQQAFTTGYAKSEWLHKTMNKELLPCEVTLVRVKHKGDYFVASYTRDLREHNAYLAEIKKANENLRIARDAAEAANKAKSVFLANMSHEIRTPMNSIIGFSELAQNGDIPEKTREYLNSISESAGWLLQIINDILDISKIESGKMELEKIPFNLHEIFEYCQQTIMPKTVEKGIALYCYAEPSIGKKMLGDPVRLRQVLINLLSNAVKFTNVGTVKLMASVKSHDANTVSIYFEVKDSGIGMTADQVKKIFDPFIQADGSITRKYGGTGLGLTITRNIIEMMGGALHAESTPGIGSKFGFELTFNIIKEPVSLLENKITITDLEKPNFKGEILVCEDNRMNQKVICEHLENVGIKVVVAENGKEGVDIVTKRVKDGMPPFDLIFMDMHMPVMDGLEAASKISAFGLKTPIVAVTANIMSNDLKLYKTNGICDFLGKPFNSQEFWKFLLKYLTPVSFTAIDENRQSAETEKFLKYLKVTFVKDNQTKCDDILNAFKNNDKKTAYRMAHTLKTNAAQIGEKSLQEAAFNIEKLLSENKSLFTEDQSPIEECILLDAQLKAVLETLSPLLAEADMIRPIEHDEEKIKILFEKLEAMLNDRNPECIRLLDDIRAIEGAEALIKQIEDYEFKQALTILSSLKEKHV